MGALKSGLIALGLVAGLVGGAGVPAQQNESQPLKSQMGTNYQVVANILADLVAGRYEALQSQAELMVRHAADLSAAVPPGLDAAGRAVFLAYATNLRLAATQVATIAERLAKQDGRPTAPGDLSVDYLRSAAAQHFGNLVTACALCHSQFHPQML